MIEPVRVEIARSAPDDLGDILQPYSTQGVPNVGIRLVTEIRDRLRQLSEFPDSGRMVREFNAPSLRELEYPPFRIVYRREDGAVTVVRVWRSERLTDSELPGNAIQWHQHRQTAALR